MLDRLKFRYKIVLLVVPALIGLLAVTGVALLLNSRADRQLSQVETTYLPLLEIDRDLKALFTSVTRALEGAASAADPAMLVEADSVRDQFIAKLSRARPLVAENGGDAGNLLQEFREYYAIAREVSARLGSGAASEETVAKIEGMRAKQQVFAGHLDASTTPNRTLMAAAFSAGRQAHARALVVDILAALATALLTLWLSWRIISAAVQSLSAVQEGMKRLSLGEFGRAVQVAGADEFGDLAQQTNQTAARLREYRDKSQREDWIKTGLGGLTAELVGEWSVSELGTRTVSYLARYLDATVAAAYATGDDGALRLLGSYSYPAAPPALAPRDGLLGQAARDGQLRVIADVPADYVTLRSSLGQAAPRHLVLAPFGPLDRPVGVLEFGALTAWGDDRIELLGRARAALGVAFRVAESRQRVQELLEQTQQQAEELQAQQEDLRQAYDTLEARSQALRASEGRLQTQQEELRQTNEELEQQTHDLEAQTRAVEHKNKALETAQRQLHEKAEELSRASRYKSEFLANMSHELRTPLNSVMILSQMLAENEGGRLADKQVEFAQVIHKSGSELLALINEVLDLSKIESGRQEVVLETVALADVAKYVRGMFQPQAARKGLALEMDDASALPAEIRHIRTDRMRLEQILKNLLSNAIKFTECGGITVKMMQPRPGYIAIAVSDTGMGIPANKQQLIFEAFAQGDGSTSRKYGGTGLGLAIGKRLAQRLGGDLRVDSEEGVGATFTLELPAVAGELAPADGVAAGPAAISPPVLTVVADDRGTITPGDPCLLVIEDDATFARLVLNAIREAGFKALVAADGRSGVELAQRYKPSGIILDVGLPDMDGWSVMERLKADVATNAIPVHFVTGGDGAARAESLGAVGFLSKPVDAHQLKEAIHRLEGTTGASLRRVLVVEDDPTLRQSLMLLLASRDNDVEAVGSGEEALRLLASESFGCLVLDLGLPDKQSGLDFFRRLRADGSGRSIPVIVHTGMQLTQAEVRDLETQGQTVVVLKGERSPERVLEEVRLFLHRVRKDLPEQRQRMTQLVHGEDQALRGKKVLVADDDMRNVYSLSSVLRSRGLEVLIAADGNEALAQLAEHPDTDAVLMDIMMPHMDGYEAMQRIRQDPRFAKLPVIALTAKTMPGDREKCLQAGASDYIPKPVDTARLHSMLRVWMTDAGTRRA